VRQLKGTALNMNSAADHVRALLRLPAAMALAKTVELLKANSSRWIHQCHVLLYVFLAVGIMDTERLKYEYNPQTPVSARWAVTGPGNIVCLANSKRPGSLDFFRLIRS
jgi:hypothetical protein